MIEEIYLAGGCLWGVQEFLRHLPGVVFTEAGRVNGNTDRLDGPYDGYAECVRTRFDSSILSLEQLFEYFFEIIDPYSLNKQGEDVGEKYRTGIYSLNTNHLSSAQQYISEYPHSKKVCVEVLSRMNYLRSAEEHQDRLRGCPDDYCHISKDLLYKYREDICSDDS